MSSGRMAVLGFVVVWASTGLAAEPPVSPDLYSGLRYRALGPTRGGRVTAVAGHRARPGTFYLGATGGGVWRTDDYGHSWRNLSDASFATGSIGAIRVAESDPDVVWVGTGSDGLRSNVIIGKGVYRSDDGGATWTHAGLDRVGNVGALLVHPRDPERVLVAAIGNPFAPNPERGIYLTRDGGRSWEHVLFVSERTGAVDLEAAPDDPDTIYAATWEVERRPWTILSGGHEGGLLRSDDGGESWRRLSEGLPSGLRGKADLAVTAAAPNRVYALVEAPEDEGGVYRSDDRGGSWRQVSSFQPIRNRPFYFTNLEAHPRDPDVLWAMAEELWKSSDGGGSWESVTTPHVDNHDMWIHPDDPKLFIASNDGGAAITRDGGASWSSQLNQPTAELYQLDVSDDFPYRLYAGQQDHPTISVPSRPPRRLPGGPAAHWEEHGGCETGPAVPKPGAPEVVYANCKGRFGVYDRRSGQEQQHYVGFWNLYGHNPKDLRYRFQRVAPIHVSPHDPDRVYHGSQYVHVTEDGGRIWETISPDLTAFTPETQVVSGAPITRDVTGEEHFSALYDIQESPHEPGVIWAGSNDGPVHLTRDGGRTWSDVTPPGIGPHGRVQQIEVSPHEPGRAYVCILRYLLGDFAPYAFRTDDYGATWTLMTTGANGVPADHPVRVVREDPEKEGLLYLGSEFGMFVSFDGGARWQSLQLNLPAVPVTDIKRVGDDLALSTMGRGFWVLYGVGALRELPLEEVGAPHLFAVGDALRLRYEAGSSGKVPDYPPPGAMIDYYLPRSVETLRLEILDDSGATVRRFEAPEESPPPGARAREDEMSHEQARTPPPLALELAAGMHRVVWDLRHPGPWHAEEEDPDDGPLVAGGIYRARLTAGEWSATRPFDVRLDPRVLETGRAAPEDAAELERLALAVRDAMSEARGAAARIEAALGEEPDPRLEVVQNALVTGEVRYSQPMLIDQLLYLYRALDVADQAPGREAEERYGDLRRALDEQLAVVRGVLGEAP